MRTVLTIAGSDPSAGAGIQADLKTFAAHHVYGICAVTAITVQNTRGVSSVQALPADVVTAQIEAVVADLGAHAVKTGMLANAAIVEAVAAAIQELELPLLVVDPVMISTSGERLLDDDATAALRSELLPRTFVVTPNTSEAAALAGIPVRTQADRQEAARRISALGPAHVLLTGGHDSSPTIVDLLYDGHHFHELATSRIPGKDTHGTGCAFSAAIAAHLANGHALLDAIPQAQRYVAGAIDASPKLGHGQRLMDHFWRQRSDGSGRR